MKRNAVAAAAAVAAVVGLGGIIIAQAAHAGSAPATDAQLVAPAVQDGNASFFAQDQIQEVWTEVVQNYPAELPAGYSFPAKAPEFFYPTDVKDPLFQAGLPDMIAAQVWRCSWLDAGIVTPALVSTADVARALDVYWSLPSTAAYDTRDLNTDVLNKFAAENGLSSADEALYALDCQGVVK